MKWWMTTLVGIRIAHDVDLVTERLQANRVITVKRHAVAIGFVWAVQATLVLAQTVTVPAGPADSSTRPGYQLLRDEEDWSFLADRSRWGDPWDPVKFVALPWPHRSSVSLGGEVRQQYERFANEEWGAEPQDDDGYLLQRYMFHADIRLGTRVRFFGQMKSGIEMGRVGGPRPPDEDRFDFHQGYIEVSVIARSDARGIDLRVGRQESQLGSGRLVSVREGPNVRQSFDAVRAIVLRAPWRVEAFISRPVTTSQGSFDDERDRRRALWGVYAVRAKPSSSRGIDLYYLGYERLGARFDQGTARELRHSVGARVWGNGDAIDYNVEGVGQWGTFDHAHIRAWTVASDTGYRIRLAGRPRVGLRAGLTSGDGDRADDILGTFNPLFPKGAYFGLVAPTGPLNHMDLNPLVTFTVGDAWTISTNWLFFWRTQQDDGLYGVPGNLLRSGKGTSARFVGQSPGLEIEWQANRHLSFTADMSLFTAGPFLKQAPPSQTTTYLAAWTTYKF